MGRPNLHVVPTAAVMDLAFEQIGDLGEPRRLPRSISAPATSILAAPSYASMRTPPTSTAPVSGGIPSGIENDRHTLASLDGGTHHPRIGSASVSSAKPLAIVTIRPERSVLGNGLAPDVGFPVTAPPLCGGRRDGVDPPETFLAARAVRPGRPGSRHSHLCQFE
jgi:hypothetical protein